MLNVEWRMLNLRRLGRSIRYSTFLLLVLLVLLTLNCTSHRDTRQHLEFWGLGREGEVVSDLIPEFERRNPNIKVTIQQIPFTAAHEKLLTAHVGESTPDVAQMGNTWIPEFVAMRALADLGQFAGAAIDRSPASINSSLRAISPCTSPARGTSASSGTVCLRTCRTSGRPARCPRATLASRRAFPWPAGRAWSSSKPRSTRPRRGS